MLYIRMENEIPVEVSETRQQGWKSRWDWKSYEMVERIANQLGEAYLAIDQGPQSSPRFDIIKRPQIGADASKGFNGDYYPVGKIVSITPKTARVIITQDDQGKRWKFFRRKLSGNWVQEGGTWGLTEGVLDLRNPDF